MKKFNINEYMYIQITDEGWKHLEKTGLQMLNELTDMIDNIPENRPLYKDSGLWQVRSDDMEEVYFQQKVNESFYEFIKRVFDVDNSYMDVFS